MSKPIVYDLYCGLGGWSEGFLSEGYECIGFDIKAHDYGEGGYPGELRLRDLLTVDGAELKDAACIVGSSPCQKYSYMAMPWKRAKDMIRFYEDALHPERIVELNALFNAQFRIQKEASQAAGRYIPMVVENVRGAQRWVGNAKWHYGSFYLWGDVPALMPLSVAYKAQGQNWNEWKETGKTSPHWRLEGNKPKSTRLWQDGQKGIPHRPAGHWTNPAEHDGVKRGITIGGTCAERALRGDVLITTGSKSRARKRASALIAKIPLPLAQHIARCYKPQAQI